MKVQSGPYILAIGASAGGLEAIKAFLSHLNDDFSNMVIIIAQHLSPSHESLLKHFLEKETKQEILEAENNIELKPNKIYVTPYDRDISVLNDRIILTKPHSETNPKPSIDILFKSISLNSGNRSIGVILSGTGSDGAEGINDIKSAGGFVLVQKPETAKFEGMPQAAIKTGNIDLIMSPDQMGEAILKYISSHRKSVSAVVVKPDINNESLEKLLVLLSERFGTNFSGYKPSTIQRRLEKRLLSLHINSVEEYLLYIEKNVTELDELFNFILINVTNFFRDAEAFEELGKTLENIIHQKNQKDTIRIWITACSTGEEAYSIAILLTELLKKHNNELLIQIFATDIDEKVVAIARKGRYSAFDIEEIPKDILAKYFISYGTEYEVVKSIRNLILFTRHDISSNPPFLKMDMISCRNLLIYFGQELQKQILPIFHYALNVGGYLFLGKSETIGQFKDLFSIIDEKNKIYQRKVGSSLKTIKFSSFTAKFRTISTVEKAERNKLSLSEMVKDTLFNSYEHSYVVISDNYEIHTIYGDVRLYLTLQEGDMNANILKLANKELQIELRSVITKCFKDRVQVKSDIRKFELFGHVHHVRIVVRPIISHQANNELYIVIFERLEIDEFFLPNNPVSEKDKGALYNIELERELLATKEQLNSFIEELEATNEELQSMNEELQSTNEELQSSVEELGTSNEELQSSNEEIQIAYTDLKEANEELERKDKLLIESEREILANQDKYFAIMNNSIQGFVIANFDGNVYEANKAYCEIFGYTEAEIKAVSRKQLIDTEDVNLKKVLIEREQKGSILKAEVIGIRKNGARFNMEFSSFTYIDKDGHKLICSFVSDITARKQAEAQVYKLNADLSKSEKRFRTLIENSDDIIAMVDSNNIPIYRSPSAIRVTGYTDDDRTKEAQSIHGDDLEIRNKVISEVIKNPGVPYKLSFRQKHKNGYYIWLEGILTNMLHDEAIGAIVANFKDVTENKKFEEHQALFASIVNSSEDAIISKKLEGIITSWNNGAQNLFGYAPEEVIGQNISILLPSNKLDEEPVITEKLKRGEHVDHYETLRIRKDGSLVNISITISPIKDAKGKVIGASTIARDISERKKAEQEILKLNFDIIKSEKKFRTLIENSEDVIVLSDRNLKPLYRSPSLRRIIGIDDDERSKSNEVARMVHPDDVGIISRVREEILKTPGIPYKTNFRGIHKSGNYVWFEGVLTNMLHDDAINAIVSNLRNVTESREFEDRLLTSNERFNYVTKATFDAIWDWNLITDELYLGEGFEMLFGYKVVQNIGDINLWHKNIHPEDKARVLEGIYEIINSKEINWEDQYRFLKANGEYSFVNDKRILVRNDQGKATRMIGAMRDLTEIKKSELELNESFKLVSEQNQRLLNFSYIVSHNLRSHTSNIKSILSLLMDNADTETEERKHMLSHLKTVSESLDETLYNLNEIVSIHANLDILVEPLNLNEYIHKVSIVLEDKILKNSAVIRNNIPADLVVNYNPAYLESILLNFISNAIRYSDPGRPPVITLDHASDEGKTILVISDNGIGIDLKKYGSKLFGMYKTFTRNPEARGLGLFITKNQIEAMGGKITVESEPGIGTIFKIFIK